MTAKRKIHNFDFTKSHHHVALVDKAANLTEVMVMKADHEVTVSTSMVNFLEKFHGMWHDDAVELARVLGYSDGLVVLNQNTEAGGIAHDFGGVYDNFPKYITPDGSNPLLYKSANEFLTGEFSSLDVLKGSEIPDTLPYSVTQKIIAVEKAYDFLLKTSDESSDEDNINIANGDSMKELTKEEVAKQAEDLKIALAAVETMKAEKSTEVETLKGLVADMKADKDAKAKGEMVEVVKGYAFIEDEAKTGLVDTLLAMKDNTEILKAFEGARDALAAAANIDGEQGTSGKADDKSGKSEIEKGHDATAEILKSRKAKA